jgi:hypothetical protein
MTFAHSVSHRSVGRNHLGRLGPTRTVGLQVMRVDALGWFVAHVVNSGAAKVTVVSPWIGAYEVDDLGLGSLIAWAPRVGACLTLITRSPATAQHERAVEAVASAPGGRVLLNERLHAKLYVSEGRDGDGLAVLGSANMTRSSSRLHEIAALVRPRGDGRILGDLVGVVMAELRGDLATRRMAASLQRGVRRGAR